MTRNVYPNTIPSYNGMDFIAVTAQNAPFMWQHEEVHASIKRDKDHIIHCDDGPAIHYPNGTVVWVQHRVIHRLDGPAIVDADGMKVWYYNGNIVPEAIHKWIVENNITEYPDLTEDQQIEYDMRFK